MMVHNKILYVIYTPHMSYLPKRMVELTSRAKLDDVDQLIVTPYTYDTHLKGLRADTVHLIKLHPDNSIDKQVTVDYFNNLETLQHLVEAIKAHNNI